MNFEEYKRIKGLFRSNYPEGCVKISKTESELHSRVKSQVAHYLKTANWEVYSEVTFKNNGRADLVGIHKNGLAFVFEIMVSEKQIKKQYPLEIIEINAKEFNYDNFKI